MKVLFVASECTPFAKTGGLADVIGSLPKALQQIGLDVRVILPKYGQLSEKFKEEMIFLKEMNVQVNWRNQYAGLFELTYQGITYYFIDNEYYFKRFDSLYGFYDDAERFVYFNHAVIDALPELDFQPDIIHCHDWQTALIPTYLKTMYSNDLFYKEIKTVFTIHNLMYQGIFSSDVFSQLLNFSPEHYFGLEFNGNINFMKSAIVHANYVTTVSETYAEEIKTGYYGEGLDSMLRLRSQSLCGIVNGIDYDQFNPLSDPHIYHNYSKNQLEKVKNKLALQEELGLVLNNRVPMIALVSRLVEQKGLSLITNVMEELASLELQFVILGTGEKEYEEAFYNASEKYPDKISSQLYFNESLAQKIYAASDLFLMPSRFEPCGIGQLIALRYESVPIVRETGGLKDTVQPYNEFTGEGNGFSFTNYNAHDMLFTIKRALETYYHKEKWDQLLENVYQSNYSWEHSAKRYKELYITVR